MRSLVLVLAATVILSVAAALIGDALSFGSAAYLAAFVIVLLAVSLIDRDRFWGADLLREASRRREERG